MWRNLRFLMDHNYIQELFPEPSDGAKIRGMVKITPEGHSPLKLRAQKTATPAA